MYIYGIKHNDLNFKGLFDPNVLVTGSNGYIGSHLIPKLARDGYNCIICTRNGRGQEFLKHSIDNVNKLKSNKSLYKFANLDFTNLEDVNKLLKSNYPVDAVIHLGGSTFNGESLKNPKKYYENNVLGTKSLTEAMLDNNINNILYVSTASIYGKSGQGKISEKSIPYPKTPYAKTKYMAEQLINDYKVYGLHSIILRLFNVAGADGTEDIDIGKNVITYLLSTIKNKGIFTLLGNTYKTNDGTCVKDFIHIDDVTNAISKAAAKLLETSQDSQIYNLGTGVGTSLGNVIRKSIDITGEKVNLKIGNALSDEVPIMVANNSKIKNQIHWEPQKNIDDIITSCWKWIINNEGKK